MRVDGINVEFELELESLDLKEKVRIDGETTGQISRGKGQKVLFDFDSQTLLVVSKRGERMLIPTSAVVAMKLLPPPKEEPALPEPDTGEVIDGSEFEAIPPSASDAEEEPPFETTAAAEKPKKEKAAMKKSKRR